MGEAHPGFWDYHLCTIRNLLPLLLEDLEGGRPPGGTVCGEQLGTGAGLRGHPGSSWRSSYLCLRHPQTRGEPERVSTVMGQGKKWV